MTPLSRGIKGEALQQQVTRALREAVEHSGKTQTYIARRANITDITLSRVLNGKRWPTPETLGRIFDACEVSLKITVVPKPDAVSTQTNSSAADRYQ